MKTMKFDENAHVSQGESLDFNSPTRSSTPRGSCDKLNQWGRYKIRSHKSVECINSCGNWHSSKQSLTSNKKLLFKKLKTQSASDLLARKEDVYPYVKRMASSSSVHGVKEMCSATTIQARIFWIIVCVVCLAMATFEIGMILHKYETENTATKLTIESMNEMQYPIVLYCPTRWIKKTSRYNLKRTIDFVQELVDKKNDFEPEKEPLGLRTDLERFQSVAEYFKAVSIDSQMIKCTCCNQTRLKKPIMTLQGVCFILELCKSSYQTANLPTLTHRALDAELGFPNQTDVGAFLTLLSPDNQVDPMNTPDIFVQAGRATKINLEQSWMHRKSTPEQPCAEQSAKSIKFMRPAFCEFLCIDRWENKLCRNCSKMTLFQDLSDSMPACVKKSKRYKNGSMVCTKRDKDVLVQKGLAQCKAGCVTLCTEDRYKITGAPMSRILPKQKVGYALEVTFHFGSFTVTKIMDVETMSFHTLVSSIGGQTGLWLGASVVSLCQMISYCCCPCLHWKNLISSYDSFQRTFRRKRRNKRQEEKV